MRPWLTCVAVAAVAGAGCATTGTIHRPSAEVVRSLPRPAPAAMPAATIAVTVREPSGEAAASPLADAIAGSLADALAAEGYAAPAQEAQADYALACALQEAGVARTRRIGEALAYRITAECALAGGGATLWQDHFSQRYDERVFVNTMSKLPAAYDAAWLRECLLPWRRLLVWRTTRAIRRRREKSAARPSADAAPAAGAVEPPPAESFEK